VAPPAKVATLEMSTAARLCFAPLRTEVASGWEGTRACALTGRDPTPTEEEAAGATTEEAEPGVPEEVVAQATRSFLPATRPARE